MTDTNDTPAGTSVQPANHSAALPADPMVGMIERVVMDPAADLDKLERMLAMRERLDEKSASIAFANALSMARADIPPIIKDAKVDFTTKKGKTNYAYETLAGISKAIDPILAKNGLSYRFRTSQDNGRVMVTCIIQHAAGHFEETSLAGPMDQSGNKNTYQQLGSAVTYLQRYTLKAALGLSAEIDTDAQPMIEPNQEPQVPSQADIDGAIAAIWKCQSIEALKAEFIAIQKHSKALAAHPDVIAAKDKRKADLGPISAEQFQRIKQLAEIAGVDIATICKSEGISHLHDLLAVAFPRIVDLLEKASANKETQRDGSEAPF